MADYPVREPAGRRRRSSQLRTARRSGGHRHRSRRRRSDLASTASGRSNGCSCRCCRTARIPTACPTTTARCTTRWRRSPGSRRTPGGSASERSSWTRSSSLPLVLAKRLATLDRLSGGRLVVGVGQGWMPEEFEAVGVPMTRRGAGFEEHMAAMRACWQPDPCRAPRPVVPDPSLDDRTEAREGRGSAARRWHDQARGRAGGPAGRRLRGGDDGLGHAARPGGVVPRRRRRGTGRPACQPRDGRCRRTARAVHRADPVGGRRSRPRPALRGSMSSSGI